MKRRKRALTLVIVGAVIAFLGYLQFRDWEFSGRRFLQTFAQVDLRYVFAAILIIYFDYFLRAVRWKLLTRPAGDFPARDFLPAQVIGFSAIAVLGRPGDLIRPYLTSKRTGLSLSSQMAVFAVERVFDTGAFAVLLVTTLLFSDSLRSLPYYERFRLVGLLLLAGVAAAALVLFIIWRNGDQLAERVGQGAPAHTLKHKIAEKIRKFSDGLHTIHDLKSFVQVTAVSLLIWGLIAIAYIFITNSYSHEVLRHMSGPQVVLLMCASIAGSILQLPMVGGGSQLATISVLETVFGIKNPEIVASCALLLWLVTFFAIVPAGLIWSRIEHLNLKQLSEEREDSEE